MRGAVADEKLLDALIAPIVTHRVEIGVLFYIDSVGRLAGMRHLRGRREGIDVSLRLLVGDALAFEACDAIMAHNHPSGDPRASADDMALTRRLARALGAVGVTLLDHLIVARGGRTSLREAGYL